MGLRPVHCDQIGLSALSATGVGYGNSDETWVSRIPSYGIPIIILASCLSSGASCCLALGSLTCCGRAHIGLPDPLLPAKG